MEYTGYGDAPNDDLSLRQAWANMLRGLSNKQSWQDLGQGIQNTAQLTPNFIESLTRGGTSAAIGGMGDLNQLRNTIQGYLPESVQNLQTGMEIMANPMAKALIQRSPTSEQVLESVPRATQPYQGYEQHETLGQYISPALGAALPKQVSKLDKIGQALENRRLYNYNDLIKEYKTLEEAKGGKVINTDVARELSPEYRANRTLSANVHEPASQFTKDYYAELLKQTPKKDSYVLFTGGGTGAGKTSSLDSVPDIVNAAEMVYDTNMNKLPSAVKKINQALDSGRRVAIAYTYRDPVEALIEGALSRAMRMKKELGSGRTVPIEEHLKTHIGSRKTIDELMNKYRDNPNVDFTVIDNSLGKNNARATDINNIPQLDEKAVKQQLRDALENEYKSGNIDKDVYKGTLGGNK
jgi:hypothetical protein